jgi:hypothetical protein
MSMAIYLYFLAGGFLFALLSVGLGHIEGGSGDQLGHGDSQTAGHLTTGHGVVDTTGGHVSVGHHIPGHVAANGHDSAHIQGHSPLGTVSGLALRTTAWFISPLAVAAFALLFGGTGACLAAVLPASAHLVIFIIACVMGVIGFAGIKSLMTLFVRSSSAPLSRDALGSEGTLVFGIKVNEKGQQLAGQVQYEVEGLWRTTLAHTVNNIPLQRGTKVRIVGRDAAQGVVMVEAIDPLDELPASEAALSVSHS